MKFHKNKFLTTVSAIALVLAVGACSSSDDDDMALMMNGDGAATNGGDDTTNGGDDTKTPAETLADARDALKALPDDATDDVRAGAMTELVAALKLEGNEAEYLAYLEKKIADQAQTVADAEAKKASDMAKAVHKAIGDNTVLEAVANLDAPMVTLAASSAGELTATLEGYTMSAAPEEIAGWRGRTLEKDGDTTVIYTNIKDEVPTALGLIYAPASTALGVPQAHLVTDDGVGDSIKWSDVKRAGTTLSTTPGDPGADDPLALTTFAGSVRGVDGTFSCTATDSCTAPTPVGETDVLSSASDEVWTFAPTDPGAMINVKDTAYVSFGWWLNAMGTQGEYEFDAFASATGMGEAITERLGSALEGSATYEGGAAGKYAMQSTTDDSASGGHFTAAATLTANFDAHFGAANPDDVNKDGVSIGGTITDFMTGDVSRPNWKVTLTAPTASENVEEITGADTEWKTGGAVDGMGTWSANFYGEEDDTMHPMAATGEFNAAIPITGEIARISGAFGATKQ